MKTLPIADHFLLDREPPVWMGQVRVVCEYEKEYRMFLKR
jgi:hypothetical protein